MCGIVGICGYGGGDSGISEQMITRMRDTMVHRGPDDAGIYLSADRKVALGHRRLSIIDLSKAGRQPMSNEDGTVWITYNGEIYNHLAIREELEQKGHIYRSNTDTETIIHLYEEEGIECLHKLHGMFAFAIWDENHKRLFLARDRIGIKPLYYTRQNNSLIFASEIKAILAHPDVSKQIDLTSLPHYLTFSSVPAPLTLFKNVSKIGAGFLMTIDEYGHTRCEQYWDAIAPEDNGPEQTLQHCSTRLKEMLLKSIVRRTMSDVPFGVFLSGGVDSCTNVALMSQVLSSPVETFSVGIKGDDDFNEIRWAQKAAKKYRTNHHEVMIGNEEFLSFFHKLAYYQDEPLADPVCIPLYYVSKLAKDNGITVIQAGEGSDELFSGYGNYITDVNRYSRYWRPYSRLPASIRRKAYSAGQIFFRRNDKKRDFFRRMSLDRELFWGGAIAFNELEKEKLLMRGFFENGEVRDSYEIVKLHYDKFDSEKPEASFLKRMIYLELKHRLPELLLMRIDKMTMANSVEARVPFLDHELVEFAVALPDSLKIKDGQGKYILKEAVKNIVPQEVVRRRKMGFCGSSRNMMTEELVAFARDLLTNELAELRELFDFEYIGTLFGTHEAKRTDNSFKLWNLMNFGLWYRQWLK